MSVAVVKECRSYRDKTKRTKGTTDLCGKAMKRARFSRGKEARASAPRLSRQ